MRKRNIARRPYLELLLRLSGQKQIKDAYKKVDPKLVNVFKKIITRLEKFSRKQFEQLKDFEFKDKNGLIDIVKIDNREWTKKAMIRKMKRSQKGWLDEHKAVILLGMMTLFVGAILYFLITTLGGSIAHLSNVIDGITVPVPLANG